MPQPTRGSRRTTAAKCFRMTRSLEEVVNALKRREPPTWTHVPLKAATAFNVKLSRLESTVVVQHSFKDMTLLWTPAPGTNCLRVKNVLTPHTPAKSDAMGKNLDFPLSLLKDFIQKPPPGRKLTHHTQTHTLTAEARVFGKRERGNINLSLQGDISSLSSVLTQHKSSLRAKLAT